jgi:hypothetical protein
MVPVIVSPGAAASNKASFDNLYKSVLLLLPKVVNEALVMISKINEYLRKHFIIWVFIAKGLS